MGCWGTTWPGELAFGFPANLVLQPRLPCCPGPQPPSLKQQKVLPALQRPHQRLAGIWAEWQDATPSCEPPTSGPAAGEMETRVGHVPRSVGCQVSALPLGDSEVRSLWMSRADTIKGPSGTGRGMAPLEGQLVGQGLLPFPAPSSRLLQVSAS